VIVLIPGNPLSPQAMVARKAGIVGPSLIATIEELERRGLVSRVRSDGDRRRNRLVVTKEGEATRQALFAMVKEIEAPIRTVFSDVRFDLFTLNLDRANFALTKE